jgi:hypothetical protein
MEMCCGLWPSIDSGNINKQLLDGSLALLDYSGQLAEDYAKVYELKKQRRVCQKVYALPQNRIC